MYYITLGDNCLQSYNLILINNHPKPGRQLRELILKLKEFTKCKVQWHEVGIFPVLKKLENEGMVKSYWQMEGQRPRKYYTIQEQGVKQLETNKYEWYLVETLYKKLWSLE